MLALTFEIEALEPLLLTQLEGDPNSSISAPFVSGGAIRGALAHGYLKDHGVDLATDREARRLFFDGSTRFLNANLLDRLGRRTLPAPLSWFYEKRPGLHHGEALYDFSVYPAEHLEQPKNVGARYCCFPALRSGEDDSGGWPPKLEFTAPRWQVTIHTAREREKGRATKEVGAVFRYQALAAGTRLGGAILSCNAQNLDTLQALLTGSDLWLGGSRSGGYGRVRVGCAQIVDEWSETGTEPCDLAAGECLVITLLSDAILRNRQGGHADCVTPAILPAELGPVLEPGAVFKRVLPVSGFNRKWGLPLCQVPALQAGSVFVFRVRQSIEAAALQSLCQEGLGERRTEGFGRLAINCHRHEELEFQELVPSWEDTVPVALVPASKKLACRMAERLVRRELDRLLAQRIASAQCEIDSPPSRSQLSRLRAIALNALPNGDVQRVSDFLSGLKSRARNQYQEARIGEQRLLDWLQARLAEPEAVWGWLSEREIMPPQIGDARVELKGKMAREYTLRLIDGVLHKAAQEESHD